MTINIDPNLFKVGPLLVTWHGVFTALATLAGIWLAVQLARQAGFSEDDAISVAMWGIIGGIIGARVFHVVDRWQFYAGDLTQILRINEGGLAIWGSVLCGPIAGGIYAWRRSLNVGRMADVAAAPMLLGMALGRIGDVLSGEQHGAHAPGFPLAVTYTNPNTLGEIGIPVHLAVGYELVLDLAIFGVLLWLARAVAHMPSGSLRWQWLPRFRQDGLLFWTFLALYSLTRFLTELFRQSIPFVLDVGEAQLISVLGMMVGLWTLAYGSSRRSRAPAHNVAMVTTPASPDDTEEAVTSG